ncbi:hypothetical protein REPUB_Repub18cG0125100 [Reevesia pubescens]
MEQDHLKTSHIKMRGAGSGKFRRYVKELIRVNKVDLLIIVEPRVSGNTADKVIRELQFDSFTKVDAVGFSGGLWILWKNSIGSVLPWVLLGDFNQVGANAEKQGDLPENRRNMEAFLEVFASRNLIDLRAKGTRFTWSNKHKDRSLILKRLDRALCNLAWRHYFSEAYVCNLARVKKSDHCPVLLKTSCEAVGNKIPRPFRFEVAWLTHKSFSSFLVDTWKKECSLHDNLKSLTPAVKD